jgi:hypothetical protein
MPHLPIRRPGLSVFFPAYNDSGTIASLVITARQTASRLTSEFEVIVVSKSQFFNFRRLFNTVVAVAQLGIALVIRREHRRREPRTVTAEVLPPPGDRA